jgi:hypothetical protein
MARPKLPSRDGNIKGNIFVEKLHVATLGWSFAGQMSRFPASL